MKERGDWTLACFRSDWSSMCSFEAEDGVRRLPPTLEAGDYFGVVGLQILSLLERHHFIPGDYKGVVVLVA